MISHSENLADLAGALNKAQATMRNALTVGVNPHFHSKYATLESVWDACRGPLTENGLSVVQLPGFEDGRATLDTMLLHTSGQWIRATAGTPISKQDPQGVGSAITYLRRYALMAVTSISPEDDDGNGAAKRSGAKGGGGTSPAPKRERSTHAVPTSGGGVARAAQPSAAPTLPSESLSDAPLALLHQPDPLKGEELDAPTWPYGQADKGKLLSSFSSEQLLLKRKWLVAKQRNPDEFRDLIDAIDTTLAGRGGE